MNPEFELLTNLGSAAVQTAIEEYTRFYLVSSTAWLLAFASLAIGAAKILKKFLKTEMYSDEVFVGIVISSILAIAFFLAAVSNIPGVTNPKAVAIHQLLKDARGK